MPPKDIKPQTLFFSTDNGKTYKPLGKITEFPETACETEDDERIQHFGDEEMTFTATTIVNRNVIRLLFGDKKDIPNNWLKMHGIPMRRKRK